MGKVFYMKKGQISSESGDSQGGLPVGTIWLYTANGTFEVPITGTYKIEMHGGGGGSTCSYTDSGSYVGATGGGSGEIYETTLSKGTSYNLVIGTGGTKASMVSLSSRGDSETAGTGGTTSFGDLYSLAGGTGAYVSTYGPDFWEDGYSVRAGSSSGSAATAGIACDSSYPLGSGDSLIGGKGNVFNTTQTYGNGGSVSSNNPQNGQPGAIIITLLSKGAS